MTNAPRLPRMSRLLSGMSPDSVERTSRKGTRMTSRSVRRLSSLLVAVLVIAALAPAAASAQNVGPTDEQYENGVLALAGSGNDPGSQSGSQLPFTGLDALAIAAVGIALVGAGFAVRRASRIGDDSGLNS